nr:Ig-like domain-containing protein [Pasteurella testudinis]
MENVTIDQTTPIIADLKLKSSDDTGYSDSDNMTNNNTPILEGTTEPGAIVRIYVDGSYYSGVADSTGKFEIQVEKAMDDGQKFPRVFAVDAAGNATSEISPTTWKEGTPFIVDTTPNPATISVSNGNVVVTPNPSTQDTHHNVEVTYVNSNGEEKTVSVQRDGATWTTTGDLPEGATFNADSGVITLPGSAVQAGSTITAVATDTAGNKSTETEVASYRPEFAEDAVTIGYFENQLAANAVGQVVATDVDNKVVNYYFVDANGNQSAVSPDGMYSINNQGEIFLTMNGGALLSTTSGLSNNKHNDYETRPNEFSGYNVVAVDETNLVSEELAVTFEVNNVLSLPYLYYPLNETNGVSQGSVDGANSVSGNQQPSTDTSNPNFQFTSQDADKILIGYTESGNAATGLGWGNVERGAVLSTLAGDDYVQLSQSVGSNNMAGGIDLGSGNNTLIVGNDIIGGSTRSWVVSGDGDDTIIVGDFSYTVGDRDDIQNATVLTGAGNDTLRLQGGDVKAASLIDMGAGNDSIVLTDLAKDSALRSDRRLDTTERNAGSNSGGSLQGGSVVVLGAGDDSINITRNFSDSTIIGGMASSNVLVSGSKDIASGARNVIDNGQDNGIDTVYVGFDMSNNAKAYLGAGDDVMSIGTENGGTGNISGSSIIDMGAGNDVLTVGVHNGSVGNVDNSTINMDAGNDTVTIKGIVQNGAKIDMGEGNNILTIGGGLNNNSSVTFGSGDDQLTINGQLGVGTGNPTISMGAGNDTVTWGGTSISSTNQIDGGAGKDTLILTTTTNTHTGTNSITNLGSSQFKGFEVIEMKNSGNSVDIRYSDLLSDTTNESPLYIKGVAGSKVDLGQNNYNSDSASSANLSDSSVRGGSWSKQSTTVVDGVTYDVYHHSTAGTDTSNDVYIQTGIIVI